MTGPSRYIASLRQISSSEVSSSRQPCYALSNQEPLVLGRDPRCQIVLDPLLYRAVSRRHAEISPIIGFAAADGHLFWQVCDLESANGTYVNGQRLQGCRVLQTGDRIMLGQNGPEFLFECQLSERSQPVPPPPPPANPAPRRTSLPGTQPGSSKPASSKLTSFKPPAAHKSDPESESVSLTQLFPIFSTGRELTRKAYLLPGGLTVAFVVLLFLAVGQPLVFNLLLAGYLASAAFYFIYELCGKRKPWWSLAGATLLTMLLLVSPLLNLFIFVFRQVLPGQLPTNNATIGFPLLLLRMFFGAGLMEELLKAIPLLIAYVCGQRLREPWRDRMGIREPLDGILLGAASAVGFTLMETLGQYVPDIYNATIGAGEDAAQLASLQLLIPRVLGSVAGHMAYTGYLGYFIGLSVLRRRWRWRILGVGYLTASGLHALWNASGELSPVLLALVGLLSYAFLTAAILKARELSPTRSQNFATRFYR